jgi:hypothetical protein
LLLFKKWKSSCYAFNSFFFLRLLALPSYVCSGCLLLSWYVLVWLSFPVRCAATPRQTLFNLSFFNFFCFLSFCTEQLNGFW